MIENREHFRWHVDYESCLEWEGGAVKSRLRNISWGGATVALSEGRVPSCDDVVLRLNGSPEVLSIDSKVIHRSLDTTCGDSWLGLRFSGLSEATRRRVVIAIERSQPDIETCFRNTTEFLETLLTRHQGLLERTRVLPANELSDLIQKSFEDLDLGEPLSPPAEFRRVIRELPPEDWEALLATLRIWSSGQGNGDACLDNEALERMAQGFLWGSALLSDYLTRQTN
jgi:hypothetical protein